MSSIEHTPKHNSEAFAHYLKGSLLEAQRFLPPGLVVVELHGLYHADVTSAPGQLLGIVGDTLCHYDAWDGHGNVPLLSACVLARRPRADDEHNARSAGGDLCAVLAVCATGDPEYSLWLACSVTECSEADYRYGVPHPDMKCVVAQICPAVLHDCFTRHATISADGTIARNADDGRGCASCARTWRGHAVLSRRSLRRGPLGRVYDIKLHESVAARFTLADIAALCMCAVIHAAALNQRKEEAARVRRLVVNLLTNISLLADSCVRAAASGATDVLTSVAESDDAQCQLISVTGVNAILFWDLQTAKDFAEIALCALCSLRALFSEQAPTGEETAASQPRTPARTVPPFIARWRAMTDVPHSDEGMFQTSVLMAEFMWTLREHYGPADGARRARHAEIVERYRATQMSNGVRRVTHNLKPPADLSETAPVQPGAWRCGGQPCLAPRRRIVSGCMVTSRCTAGCQATFHRACWKARCVARADRAACPTPDCWGEITEVTSTRLRGADCRPHILWQSVPSTPAPKKSSRPAAARDLTLCRDILSTARCDTTTTQRDHPRDENRASVNHGNGNGDDASTCLERDRPEDDTADLEEWRYGLGDATTTPSRWGVAGATAQTTGGVPYRKCPLAIEPAAPQRAKRPRDRRGKRQRQRLAKQKQQQDRILALAGLAEPLAVNSAVQPAADLASANYADDALWPPFFVPGAVLG